MYSQFFSVIFIYSEGSFFSMAWEFVIGAGIGGIAGYFIGKYSERRKLSNSDNVSILTSLNNQVVEMKAKFDEYEKFREEKEKASAEMIKAREKRYEDFVESVKKFFEDQETFRKEAEKKRDMQLEGFANVITAFNRTVHGTKTRGNVGEDVAEIYLKEAIKANIVKKNLRTESGEVEFAWNLGDEMFVPIDSKFPDIMDLLSEINDETTQADKNKVKKKVFDKILKEIERVTKYHNQSNTINKSILIIPGGSLDLCPELIERGIQKNVFVTAPEQALLIGYIISEEYEKTKEEGDVGALKDTNKKLLKVFKEILYLTDTLERQAKSVLTHNDKIKEKSHEALRL